MTDNRQPTIAYVVNAPAPHEGIERALRGSFGNASATLPDDMARLLNRLR